MAKRGVLYFKKSALSIRAAVVSSGRVQDESHWGWASFPLSFYSVKYFREPAPGRGDFSKNRTLPVQLVVVVVSSTFESQISVVTN